MRTGFFIFIIIIITQAASGQKNTLNWDSVKADNTIPKKELNWLLDSVSSAERASLVDMVLSLSQPAEAQLISSFLLLDGSYNRTEIKPYLDSFYVRPPQGNGGLIRVAYLSARLRKIIVEKQEANKVYVSQFSGNTFSLPKKQVPAVNPKIALSFDFTPANTIIEILSTPDITADEILKKINTHFFKLLYEHHSQSFYKIPLTSQQLAFCLERAASSKPIDVLYRYINPYGLLNYNDVKNNLAAYKSLLGTFAANEKAISNYIRASISPSLPDTTRFSRRVSFFMITGADGWADQDVAALDINFYKDDYTKVLNLLVHETYHSGQDAVALKKSIKRNENEQTFADALNDIFLEGTATYIAPPQVLTPEAYRAAVIKGTAIAEKMFNATIIKYDTQKAQLLYDEGIAAGGPFYYLGAEMAKTIATELGEKALAGIIPYNGVMFFKTYFKAINSSKHNSNLFSTQFEQNVRSMR